MPNPLLPVMSKKTANKISRIFRYLGILFIIVGILLFVVKYYVPALADTVIDAVMILILGLIFLIQSFGWSMVPKSRK